MGMAGSKAMMNALPDIAEDAGSALPATSRQMLMAQYEHLPIYKKAMGPTISFGKIVGG